MDYHTVPQNTCRRAAPDRAFLNITTGDGADFRDPEDLPNFHQAEQDGTMMYGVILLKEAAGERIDLPDLADVPDLARP